MLLTKSLYNEKISTAFIALFSLFTGFIVHRLLTLSQLSPASLVDFKPKLIFFSVGLLSDFWVSSLISFFIFLLSFFLKTNFISNIFFYSISFLTSIHNVYVEFFNFQIIPFHLQYFSDLSFIRSNGSSIFSASVILNLLFFLIPYLFFEQKKSLVLSKFKNLKKIYFFIITISLLAHSQNIILKMKLFVPENLQHNWIEHLYIKASKSRIPPKLTADQFSFLRQVLERDGDLNSIRSTLLRSAATDYEIDHIGLKIRDAFKKAKASKSKPILMIILLESFRPSETGIFVKSKVSLTPYFDELAKRSIVFKNAYSTGSVTRGAQEAVLCSYLGARETSMMRGNSAVEIDCLPEFLNKNTSSHTFWYHGGDGRFDSQLDFWKSHGIKDFLSQNDFPKLVAKTDWGVSDKVLLERVIQKLLDAKKNASIDELFGLILTVTNHIPWKLPSDTSKRIEQLAVDLSHPSWATTAYTDEAIHLFIERMKTQDLWKDSIIIFVSDHGNTADPYGQIYENDPYRTQRLQSHINLMISGGLVEQSLQSVGFKNLERHEFVSQADINLFASFLLNAREGKYLGDPLFTKKRKTPVLTDIEQGLFNPQYNTWIENELITDKNLKMDTSARSYSLIYFRAFLQYILGNDDIETSMP